MISLVRPNTFAASILLAVVAFAPLPLGSTIPAVIAAECALLGLAAMTLTLRNAGRAQIVLLLCLAIVPVGYLLVLHEQLSEHPWFALEFPSPWWSRAEAALGEPLRAARTVMRDQPLFSIGPALAAALALLTGLVVATDRIWARRIIDWALWIGTAYALFGIVSFISDPTRILSFEKYAYRDVLTGTFINRNTAAVYFGACFSLAAVKFAVAMRTQNPSEQLHLPRRGLPQFPRRALLPLLLCIVNLMATLMTASRAGIVLSVVVSLVCVGTVFRSRFSRGGSALPFAAMAIAFVAIVVVIAGGMTNRFASQGLGDGGRLEIYEATLRMIGGTWLFGTGLGTFRWGFSPYRPDDVPVWGIWDRAHNIVLEIAAEAGVPLALLVLAAGVAITVLLIRGAVIRRRDRDIPIAALGVALIGFAHAMIDFSLQIPGYAIPAFAVMGAGLAQSFSTSKRA